MLQDKEYIFKKIKDLLEKSKIYCADDKIYKLSEIVLMLSLWNSKLNLTAIKNIDDMILLHIIDSALISPYLNGNNIADVGTGAGFPGLVIALLNDDKSFTLIDSIHKKLSFVRNVSLNIGLKNVNLICKRCEDINIENKFDCIVSRAFAPLDRMIKFSHHLLKDDGIFIAMKAHLDDEELRKVPKSVEIIKIEELKIPTLDVKRSAVFLRKNI